MTVHLPLAVEIDPFARRIADDGQGLRRDGLSTLQLNVGKMCNLACNHCHVEAGPARTEIMNWEVMKKILVWMEAHHQDAGLEVVDLTGGAPEMNPYFRELIGLLKAMGLHVLDRCNLTILLVAGYEDLIDFLAGHEVEIVASLPCYLEKNVDAQRGKGVFDSSIRVLQRLNEVGYGQEGSELRLNLVYNPVGYGLPPEQGELEEAFKGHLAEQFGIVFNRLWTITNMPIKRFEHALRCAGEYDAYMNRLVNAHRAENVEAVMCRSLVSVGWQGTVYDCDFNQMLQMPIEPSGFGPGDDERQVERNSRKLWQYTVPELLSRPVRSGAHCFGCTAGAGSSCTGTLG